MSSNDLIDFFLFDITMLIQRNSVICCAWMCVNYAADVSVCLCYFILYTAEHQRPQYGLRAIYMHPVQILNQPHLNLKKLCESKVSHKRANHFFSLLFQ